MQTSRVNKGRGLSLSYLKYGIYLPGLTGGQNSRCFVVGNPDVKLPLGITQFVFSYLRT